MIKCEGWIELGTFTPDVRLIAKAAAIWRDLEASNEVLAREKLRVLLALFAD